MSDKQTQRAGDNSQLMQAGTVIVGIDEKRAREIVDEKLSAAMSIFTAEALTNASERSRNFNGTLIRRMVQEDILKAFSDPSFQILLVEAQKSAASTERARDYNLLTELMIHRFKKDSNRVVRAGISRAVEIVDQISDEALLGITVLHSVTYFSPLSGDMAEGMNVLDDLFGKIIYDTLPTSNDWLDHLDILDAIRLTPFGSMKLLEDYWYDYFDGYIKNGFKEGSEKHTEAIVALAKVSLGPNILVKNPINATYVKLPVPRKGMISKLSVNKDSETRAINTDEIAALENVYEMYDGTTTTKEDFIREIEKRPNLKKLRDWWNTLNRQSIQITSVGKVLAHSNAQRIDPSLPSLD